MSPRQSFLAYAALIVGVISFVTSFARPLVGQQAVPAQSQVGRYQIATTGSSGFPNLYVIDTASGKIWHAWAPGHEPMKEWEELKPLPASK